MNAFKLGVTPIIDTVILTCPVLVSASSLGIFISLADMYYSQNKTFSSISQMLDSSDEFMQAVVPAASILTATGLITTSSFVYQTRCSLIPLQCSCRDREYKSIFFINSVLQRLSYAMFQCAIAVTLTESRRSHYVYSAAFFTLFPLSTLVDTYIYFTTMDLKYPFVHWCNGGLKVLTSAVSCLGISKILYYLCFGHQYSQSSLIAGEFALLGAGVLHSLSLGTDLYSGLYGLNYIS